LTIPYGPAAEPWDVSQVSPPRRPGVRHTAGIGYLYKRLLLGRPIATARLEHERLGKPTALAVFSSDNMSSVAYATEEILRALIPVVGVAAFALVLPISAAIVLVEAILIFSYRQTIKAYPSAGGAYIVTKDNLGLLPAQLAGVALLIDYVLTVSVSVAAGVEAISSVFPLAVPVRIVLSLFFIWLIAYGNLLGVRESGRIFALPTYVFIVSLYLTCGVGLYEVLTHHVAPFTIAGQHPGQLGGGLSVGAGAVGLFIVLKAFASGGAAVTGVEAISNGVPAFRKPEWKNAQQTLVYMGLVLGGSFLAVSYLAHRLHVIPVKDESKSVLGQIGQLVYGHSAGGHVLFLLLQVSTTLILILAANTSFADFPRLASFHAGDAFMPRQLTKRGHKLVFSNGVVALAAASTLVVVVLQASVTKMIPLYALGVFTSFTLSQTGMTRRHLRLKEKGWRLGLFVNGLGAFTTFVVAIIIAKEKFFKGAWVVVLLVPLLVFLLVRVNKTYEGEDRELSEDLNDIKGVSRRRHIAYVLVDALDEKTVHAIQYALTIHPAELHCLHIETSPQAGAALRKEWDERGPGLELETVSCPDGERGRCLAAVLRGGCPPDTQATVIVPALAHVSFWQRVRSGRSWSGLVEPLRSLDNVSVVAVREHAGAGHPVLQGRLRILGRPRHIAVILVGQLDRSVLKALQYTRSMGALEIRALHAAADPDLARKLLEEWAELGHLLQVPLDVDECADRNIARTVREYVQSLAANDVEVSVVVPRRDYPGFGQRLLHDRTSRKIRRALSGEAHVDVVSVPYRMGAKQPSNDHPSDPAGPPAPDAGSAEPGKRHVSTPLRSR
jgi:amino acid transporter